MADKIMRLTKDPATKANTIRLVEGDNQTYTVTFVIDRYWGGVDLSTLVWSINMRTEAHELYYDTVTVTNSDDENIYIDWNVRHDATSSRGMTFYTVEATASGEDAPLWRSSVQGIEVAEGINAGEVFTEEDLNQVEQVVLELREIGEANNVEVTGIRNGEDGLTYASAGDAVRTQIGNVNGSLINTRSVLDTTLGYMPIAWEQGYFSASTETLVPNYIRSNYIPAATGDEIDYEIGDGYSLRIYSYQSDKSYLIMIGNYTGNGKVKLNYANIGYLRLRLNKTDESNLTPKDGYENVTVRFGSGGEMQNISNEVEELKGQMEAATVTRSANYTNTLFYSTSASNKWALRFDLPMAYSSVRYTPYFRTTGSSGVAVTSGIFTLTRCVIDGTNEIVSVGESTLHNIGDELVFYNVQDTDIWFITDVKKTGESAAQLAYSNAANATFTGAGLLYTATVGVGSVMTEGTNIYASGEFTIFGMSGKTHSILDGKNITVIGDSITAVTSKASVPWPSLIQEWTGAEVQNLGINGTGFVRSQPYIDRIDQIDSNADIIGVACSFNDLVSSSGLPLGTATDTGTDTIGGYIHDFFEALTTAKPTTPLLCYSEGPWGYRRPGNEDNGGSSVYKSGDYISLVKEVCALYGVPFYDGLYWGCALKPWVAANKALYYTSPSSEADEIHPNNLGHIIIARYLYSKFEENLVADGLD